MSHHQQQSRWKRFVAIVNSGIVVQPPSNITGEETWMALKTLTHRCIRLVYGVLQWYYYHYCQFELFTCPSAINLSIHPSTIIQHSIWDPLFVQQPHVSSVHCHPSSIKCSSAFQLLRYCYCCCCFCWWHKNSKVNHTLHNNIQPQTTGRPRPFDRYQLICKAFPCFLHRISDRSIVQDLFKSSINMAKLQSIMAWQSSSSGGWIFN